MLEAQRLHRTLAILQLQETIIDCEGYSVICLSVRLHLVSDLDEGLVVVAEHRHTEATELLHARVGPWREHLSSCGACRCW